MNNENKTIHDFDFTFICEYFQSFERQGPGSPEVTRKALNLMESLPGNPVVADLGCGTGGQTRILAEQLTGPITGLDLFPGFIDKFNEQATKAGYGDRLKGIVGSMDNLPFEKEQFDLIWSEGAIYNMGFEEGLTYWNSWLKPGGFVAVTEACWFTPERPEEIEAFWMGNYPGIDMIPANVGRMQKSGYIPVAHFILPENCWTEYFFEPQIPVQEEFLKKYEDNPTVKELIRFAQYERKLYDQYKQYYGYVFFIGQKE